MDDTETAPSDAEDAQQALERWEVVRSVRTSQRSPWSFQQTLRSTQLESSARRPAKLLSAAASAEIRPHGGLPQELCFARPFCSVMSTALDEALDESGTAASPARAPTAVAPDRRRDLTATDAAMARYADGDNDAFAAVYDGVAPALESYLRRRVRNKATVDDLIQTTFLQIHRGRAAFIRGAPVLPWALVIASRLFRAGARRHAREIPGDTEVAAGTPLLVAPAPSAEESAMAFEVSGALDQAFARLTKRQRAAFDLVKGQELSYADAARTLQTTVTSIKLLLHRCYVSLRAAANRSDDCSKLPLGHERGGS